MIGCECAVCCSQDPRNKRYRPSVLVETENEHIVVDTPPDFRSQCLANNVRRLDAIVITHAHADHVLGLDDVRRFCANGRVLPLYAARDHLEILRVIFAHAFDPASRLLGWPQLDGYAVEPFQPFHIGATRVTAMELPHGRATVYGYLFENGTSRVAYLTDCKTVPPAVIARLRGASVLVLDALRYRPHFGHLTVSEALAVVAETKPERAYFTHICHDLDHATVEGQLPSGVRLAYDGLVIDV